MESLQWIFKGNSLSPGRPCAGPHAQVCMMYRKTNQTNCILFAEIRAYRWRHAALFPSGYYDCHQNDSEAVRTVALF